MTKRAYALDALRGYAIITMVLSATVAWNSLPGWMDHAKSAGVPIIVAVNKIDKPNINIERVYTEMSENGITPESWGGEYPFINLSAKTGEGVDNLLETILAIAEVKELKANPNRYALGAVIEEKLDKNVGSTVTLLVQNGTLRLGDPIVVGTTYGKVRTLKDDLGREVVEALPSMPVEITGLSDVPSSGDRFMAFETEKEAKTIAENRKEQAKLKNSKNNKAISLDDLFDKIKSGVKEINVILKTDVKGTEEAVKNVKNSLKELGGSQHPSEDNSVVFNPGTKKEFKTTIGVQSHQTHVGNRYDPGYRTDWVVLRHSK
jgi:translation initiation factor IF-2